MGRVALTLATALVLLAACGYETEGTETVVVPVATGAVAAPASANTAVPATAAPTVTPEVEGGAGAPAAVEAAARAVLADEVGATETALSLNSAEKVEWPDASLGCPQEGFAYAQLQIPGYRLLFSHQGAVYAVHTNEDGSRAVVCEDTVRPEVVIPSVTPEVEGGAGAPAAVEAAARAVLADEVAARAVLADEVGASETALSLDSAEKVEWPDASLGCPQEEFAYAQLQIPGYRLLFSHQGAVYAVHTNEDGSRAVVCEDDRT